MLLLFWILLTTVYTGCFYLRKRKKYWKICLLLFYESSFCLFVVVIFINLYAFSYIYFSAANKYRKRYWRTVAAFFCFFAVFYRSFRAVQPPNQCGNFVFCFHFILSFIVVVVLHFICSFVFVFSKIVFILFCNKSFSFNSNVPYSFWMITSFRSVQFVKKLLAVLKTNCIFRWSFQNAIMINWK